MQRRDYSAGKQGSASTNMVLSSTASPSCAFDSQGIFALEIDDYLCLILLARYTRYLLHGPNIVLIQVGRTFKCHYQLDM